jgi:hypothetical protein
MVYDYNSDPMPVDMRKISGAKKNVWWMDAATGALTFIGTFDNGTKTFFQQNPHRGTPNDGVLIAVDADKNYIGKNQKSIAVRTACGDERNLEE